MGTRSSCRAAGGFAELSGLPRFFYFYFFFLIYLLGPLNQTLVTRKIKDVRELHVVLGSLAPSSLPLPRIGARFTLLTLKYKILPGEADASRVYAEEQHL